MAPVYWTNWGAAKRTFPQAVVLAKPNSNKPYGRDPYGNYLRRGTYYDNDRLIYPVERMSFAETDRIAKLVPADLKMTIKKALEAEPELENLYHSDPKVTHLLDTARRLEGLARHASTHAAGLVVSDKPMGQVFQGDGASSTGSAPPREASTT